MTVGCGTLLSTLAVCPKEAVAKRRQNAKIVIFIMILVRSRDSAKCTASARSWGNRHTKSERLGFELGKSRRGKRERVCTYMENQETAGV
jgi:hypothetical protein